MNYLVSPNEPKKCKEDECAVPSTYPESIGADFVTYSEYAMIPSQRKTFPKDFLASIDDGRLVKECAMLREATQGGKGYPFLILEGKPRYKGDTLMVGRRTTRWSRTGIRNQLRSIRFVEGIDIEFTLDISDTIRVVKELQEYFDTTNHFSIRNRARIVSDWPSPTYQERFLYFLQSLPDIKVGRAMMLSEHYTSPIEVLNATIEELSSVRGIGKKTAGGVYNFLRGVR